MADAHLGEITATLRLRDEMTAQLRAAESQLSKTGNSLRTIGTNLQSFGSALLPFSAAIAGAGAASAKLFADFETSTTRLVTLSGVSVETMQDMREAILALGPAVGIGPRALAEAMLVVTSTGIRGAEAMEILERAARASALGLGDTRDVARAVTSAITAYGKENLSAAEATDILFATVKAGGAEANELAGTLGRVVGIASQTGVSFKELGAFLATFTRLGVDSAEAVTALRGVLATVLKPSQEAREQLVALGSSIEDLRASIREKGLTAALLELVQSANGSEDAIAAIVPNVRALAGIMGTAGAQADQFTEVLQEIEDGAGGVDRAFKVLEETTGFTFNQLVASLETAAIELGKALNLKDVIAAAKPLFDLLVRLAEGFGDLPRPVKTAILAIAGLLAVGGPFAFAIGGAIRIVGDLARALAWFTATSGGKAVIDFFRTMATTVLPGYTVAAESATVATSGLRGALGLIGLAAVSVGTGFLLAKRDMDQWLETQAKAKRAADEWERLRREGTADPEFLKLFSGTAFKPLDESVNIGALTGGLSFNLKPAPAPPPSGGGSGIVQFTEEVKALIKELGGSGVRQRIRDLDTALRAVGGSASLNATVLADVADEIQELERRGGRLTPALRDIAVRFRTLDGVNRDVSASLRSVNVNFADMGPSIDIAKKRVDDLREKMLSLNVIDPLAFISRFNSISTVELDDPPKRLREVWVNALDSIADSFERLATIGGDIFGGIARGFGLGIAGAAEFLSGLNSLAKDGLQNTLAGVGSLVGALTAGVQAAISFGKALGDALTRSEAEKAAADIRRTLGLNVTEDDPIVQAIEALVKSGVVRNRNEAIALNLDELLKQAGGATAANFQTFLGRSVELFDLLDRGGQVGAMALESLDAILGELGRHVVEQGGLWDEHFVAVLRRAQAEGRELASVMQLMDAEMSKVAGGLRSVVGGFLAGLPTGDATSAIEATFGSPEDLASAQTEFDRLGRIAFATFNAFIAQGKSAVEAIQLLGPSIDELIGASDRFGLAGSDAFEALRRWRDLVANNEPLLQSIAGLNDVVTGLANIGGLTAETFADLQAQGRAAFDDLIAAGFTEQEALAQMAPLLETLIDLHKRRGLEIDAETQALIDQAAEQGLLSKEAISTNDILMTGLQGLADLFGDIFGVQVPRLFGRMVDEGRAAAEGLTSAFRGIDFPDLPGLSIPRVPGGTSGFEIPQLASGGIVRRPTLAVVGEAGPEAVVPLPDLFGMQGGTQTIVVQTYLDGRQIAESTVPHLSQVVKDHRLA